MKYHSTTINLPGRKKFSTFLFGLILIILLAGPILSQDIIDTILGNGQSLYYGAQSVDPNASFNFPMSICLDDIGNIYLADTLNNRIRMVDTKGIVYTVAGTGEFGDSISRIPALSAKLAHPSGVTVETLDKENKKTRIYIADTKNNKIRMVNKFGIIKTIGGCGKPGNSGDVSQALAAKLSHPSEVTLDKNGNVYFTDTYNHRICVIYNPNDLPDPGPIACAPQIKNPKNNYIYTIAGTGRSGYGGDNSPAISANLNYPWDLCVVNEEIYFSDKNNHIIRKIDKNGIITTIAGVPMNPGFYGDVLSATKERLNTPYGIWADENYVYFADGLNNRLRKIDIKNNKISTVAGIGIFGYGGDAGPAIHGMFAHPVDVIKNKDGKLFIVDHGNSVIRVIKEDPKVSDKIIGKAE